MTKGPGSMSGFEPALLFSFFLIETLSVASQEFSKCLTNGSDRLRKGQLRRQPVAQCHDSLGFWIPRCGSVWTSVTGSVLDSLSVERGFWITMIAGFRNP